MLYHVQILWRSPKSKTTNENPTWVIENPTLLCFIVVVVLFIALVMDWVIGLLLVLNRGVGWDACGKGKAGARDGHRMRARELCVARGCTCHSHLALDMRVQVARQAARISYIKGLTLSATGTPSHYEATPLDATTIPFFFLLLLINLLTCNNFNLYQINGQIKNSIA